MSKYELPKKFDYKNVSLLKQFITETGKIIPARLAIGIESLVLSDTDI